MLYQFQQVLTRAREEVMEKVERVRGDTHLGKTDLV